MKRYPMGSAALETEVVRSPLTVKSGFKFAVGAYLGWQIAQGLNMGLGRLMTKKFGTVEEIEAKIEAWGERHKPS